MNARGAAGLLDPDRAWPLGGKGRGVSLRDPDTSARIPRGPGSRVPLRPGSGDVTRQPAYSDRSGRKARIKSGVMIVLRAWRFEGFTNEGARIMSRAHRIRRARRAARRHRPNARRTHSHGSARSRPRSLLCHSSRSGSAPGTHWPEFRSKRCRRAKSAAACRIRARRGVNLP